MDLENSKLSQVIISLREEAQHFIHVVNDKVDRLNERVN